MTKDAKRLMETGGQKQDERCVIPGWFQAFRGEYQVRAPANTRRNRVSKVSFL